MDARLLTIPTALAGGAGGTYLGYKYLYPREQKVSIKSKLGDLLLGFGDNFSDKGQARAKLVSSKTILPESLNKLRSSADPKSISSDDIKGGCKDQIEKEFSSEEDSLFVNIRDYCTFNNKDKIGGTAITEELTNSGIKADGKGSKANKKLSEAPTDGMSETMKGIKAKVVTSGGTDPKALRAGCEDIYLAYFKGEGDSDFRDAKAYCVEVSQ